MRAFIHMLEWKDNNVNCKMNMYEYKHIMLFRLDGSLANIPYMRRVPHF